VFIPLLQVLGAVSAAATVASIGYCVLATVAGLRFASARRRPRAITSELPWVSILKPLKGADPEMYEALRSHCLQEYPEYEILCGVTASDDPAVPVVERLIREFPRINIQLLLCDKRLGANGKASTLIQLAAAAKSEYLLVNDSDIRVERDYLRTVIGELQQPNTGLVTCLYRGIPEESLGSRLEALGISTDFMPGVLAAQLLEGGLHFGLGSTLAFRKAELNAIGGFEAMVDYLADDYELGRRIAQLGWKIHLSGAVVETNLPAYDFAGFWSHQLRWARTIRASRPGGYLGLLLTFAIPWALATVAVWPSNRWSWIVFATASVSRAAAIFVSSWILGDASFFKFRYSQTLREFVAVAVWIAGWFGNTIHWRGEQFLLKDGKLTRK